LKHTVHRNGIQKEINMPRKKSVEEFDEMDQFEEEDDDFADGDSGDEEEVYDDEDLGIGIADVDEEDEEEAETESAAAPVAKSPRVVKMMNGISSTDYNKMKKETKDTPHRFATKAIAPVVQDQLQSGEIEAITDAAIHSAILGAWSGAETFNERTTFTWYNHISDKAKKRLYNAVRSRAMIKETA
jgi:hypothetical protein